MEGNKRTSLCPDQDARAEGGEKQGINYGGSPNDNMASDFSTPQFHAINDVSLYYVWFANTIVNMFFTCKKNRENDLYMYNSIVLWPSFK